jgi:ferredoxin
MDKIETFCRMFQVPRAMRRHIARVVTPDEVDLILAMAGETLAAGKIAARLGWPEERMQAFLQRAYERHVVTRVIGGKPVGYVFDYVDPAGREIRYAPARFYDRLDPVTTQENWSEIPEAVRREISRWWLDGYIAKVEPIITAIKQDPEAYFQIKQKDFLLLEEALEQVEAAEEHVVLNCDCRSSEMACGHMRESCIRLDDGARYTSGRGLGRVVGREECVRILMATDRDGLMHIGGRSWREHGLFGFCNCCTCCCFPLRAARELHSERRYPRVHHQALRDPAACVHCGICVRRCPFQAFYRDGQKVTVDGRRRRRVAFDPQKCFGCGLCASACPEGAIAMQPWP